MTVLFQGNRTIQAGLTESVVFAVPQNIKQPDQELLVRVTMVWDDFPVGNTAVFVFLSTDGGLTFNGNGMGWPMPNDFGVVPPPHFARVGVARSRNDIITHAKYSTNAPAQFTTQMTVEAISQ